MKALIVDDEKHVREAIRLLVDWTAEGVDEVFEAQDGNTAIEMIENEKPELVFTDMMMPVMGGTALLEWIQKHAPRTKTVVISGHDDYELVRHTIKCGGMDYILKPIDPEELREAVRKAVLSRLEEDRALLISQRRNMQFNQIKPVYWDKIFSNLLTHTQNYSSVKESIEEEFGISCCTKECRIAVLTLDTMPPGIRRKFQSGMDLLFFSLINICNEYLLGKEKGYAFRNWNNEDEIVFLFWNDSKNAEALIAEINGGIHKTLGGRFEFGLGHIALFPDGVSQSYQDAVTALRQHNLLSKHTLLHLPQPDAVATLPLHFTDYEEMLGLAVKSGSEKQVTAALDEWFDAVRQYSCISMEQMELWRREYDIWKTRWDKQLFEEKRIEVLNPSSRSSTIYTLLGEDGTLSIDLWRKEWTASVLQLSKLYVKQQFEDSHVIFEIAKYIQTHYNEEIALQDISNQFFLSREYISRKFKREFKENISDYIGRIRIEKAKLLLLNPHYRISQIAEMVGYPDDKYFSKVFKKFSGQSPNEYRKQQGEVKNPNETGSPVPRF